MASSKTRTEPSTGNNPLARRILEQRDPTRPEISIERLEAELGDASRYDIAAGLKQLEKTGAGQFVVGRKGRKSRFVWARGPEGSEAAPEPTPALSATPRPKRQAAAAAPPASPPAASNRKPSAGAAQLLRHSFYVRPGLLAALELPEDITSDEVERLCHFLRAIPFAAKNRSGS